MSIFDFLPSRVEVEKSEARSSKAEVGSQVLTCNLAWDSPGAQMKARKILSCWRVLGVVLLALLLSGCVFDGDSEGHGRRGASLSQAMEASASGDKRPIGNSAERESSPSPTAAESAALASAGAGEISAIENDSGFCVPFHVGYEAPFNGDIQGVATITLAPLTVQDDYNLCGLYVSGGIVDFKSGSLADRGAKDPWTLESGLFYRRYLSAPKTFLSPYLTASVGCQSLFWTYRSDVVSGGETIHGDDLFGATGYAGVGVAVQRKSHLSLFAEAGFGGTTYANETDEGFSNDVFGSYGFFTVKAGLTYRF